MSFLSVCPDDCWNNALKKTTALFSARPSFVCGPGSSAGIATDYGLYGSGIESRWGRDFPHLSIPAIPSLLYNVYQVFTGGEERPGRDADPSPLLVPWSRKSRGIPLLPYGPYGLYRASVSVQGCTLPLHLTSLFSAVLAMFVLLFINIILVTG